MRNEVGGRAEGEQGARVEEVEGEYLIVWLNIKLDLLPRESSDPKYAYQSLLSTRTTLPPRMHAFIYLKCRTYLINISVRVRFCRFDTFRCRLGGLSLDVARGS